MARLIPVEALTCAGERDSLSRHEDLVKGIEVLARLDAIHSIAPHIDKLHVAFQEVVAVRVSCARAAAGLIFGIVGILVAFKVVVCLGLRFDLGFAIECGEEQVFLISDGPGRAGRN